MNKLLLSFTALVLLMCLVLFAGCGMGTEDDKNNDFIDDNLSEDLNDDANGGDDDEVSDDTNMDDDTVNDNSTSDNVSDDNGSASDSTEDKCIGKHNVQSGVCTECGKDFNSTSKEGIWFVLNDDMESYTLVSGRNCSVANVVIDYYNGLPVTAIADQAFSFVESIESLKIGENVKSIGAFAFSKCTNLKNVTFEDNGALEIICNKAFSDCTALESIIFENPHSWMAGYTVISTEEIKDASKIAEYFVNTYVDNDWTRNPNNSDNNENDNVQSDNTENDNAQNDNTQNGNSGNNYQHMFTDVDETVYVQNAVQVNIRTTPDASSNNNLAGVVDFGNSFKRVQYSEMWSGIEINGEVFYLNTYFLTDKPDEVVFTETTKTIYVTNIDPNNGDKGTIYLRTFTNTSPDPDFYPDGNVGAVAKHGAPLTVTGLSADGKWYRVDFTYIEANGTTNTVKNLYAYNGKYVTETNPIE